MRAFVHDALPGRIVFAEGSIASVADEARTLGMRRALVIAAGSSTGPGHRIVRDLGSAAAGTFAEVRQHVPEGLAEEAARAARKAQADGVITVGGGSATGLGKAVALLTGIPVLAVPTTYAGSEMTPIYGMTGTTKRTGRDLAVLPKTVVYDPALTTGLSPRVTAASGFNALAHAVEAQYAPGADPIASLVGLEAIGILGRALPVAVREPGDLAARGDLLFAACLAGSALAVAGTALHHKLCHVLGGSLGLVHADVHAVLLPHVVAFNRPAVPEALHRVAVALHADEAAAALHELARSIGAPVSLASLGMAEDALDATARQAADQATKGNPRAAGTDELRALLEDAFHGRSPARS